MLKSKQIKWIESCLVNVTIILFSSARDISTRNLHFPDTPAPPRPSPPCGYETYFSLFLRVLDNFKSFF